MSGYRATGVSLILMGLVCAAAGPALADDKEVGASLHEKSALAISAVPTEVMAIALEKRPALQFTKAEKEIRGGREYIDLEGHDGDGNEIELDMMLGETGWVVVEIQRDIAWGEVPALVQETLLQNVPSVTPARIIESDQDNGTIVYEFFTRDEAGKESKYEVSLTGEEAMFLREEWQH